MATYSTHAEMVQRYGTAALTAMIPSDATDPLTTLTAQARDEAAAEIDAALGSCGYAVPVDTSTITDSDLQTRADAMLRSIEIGLAVSALSRREESSVVKREKDAAGEIEYSKAKTDESWARERLEALCSREESLPGISQPGRTFVRHSSLAVPSATDVTNRIAVGGAW